MDLASSSLYCNVEVGSILICWKVVELAWICLYCKRWSGYYSHLYADGGRGINILVLQRLKHVLSSIWNGYCPLLFECDGTVMQIFKCVLFSSAWRWWRCVLTLDWKWVVSFPYWRGLGWDQYLCTDYPHLCEGGGTGINTTCIVNDEMCIILKLKRVLSS